MNSVMISIKPKWCELIASGEKTIEVRKTKPKCNVPFKCYIYCTKEKSATDRLWIIKKDFRKINYDLQAVCANVSKCEDNSQGSGKVIGEFVCDAIIPISVYANDITNHVLLREQPYTCLTDKQVIDYLGNGVEGFGWHISDLVIYDEPKALSEFKKIHRECFYADLGLAKRDCPECKKAECFFTRPPQSWCYVEMKI